MWGDEILDDEKQISGLYGSNSLEILDDLHSRIL
jgi:hypothetical protein